MPTRQDLIDFENKSGVKGKVLGGKIVALEEKKAPAPPKAACATDDTPHIPKESVLPKVRKFKKPKAEEKK